MTRVTVDSKFWFRALTSPLSRGNSKLLSETNVEGPCGEREESPRLVCD